MKFSSLTCLSGMASVAFLCSIAQGAPSDSGKNLGCSTAFAQAADPFRGSPLDPSRLAQIKQKAQTRVGSVRQKLWDALRNASQTRTAVDPEVVNEYRGIIYNEVIHTGTTTNQAQSGRCWNFAGFNVLRGLMLGHAPVPESFEFSQSYLQFYYMLEQSAQYLENVQKSGSTRMRLKDLKILAAPNIEQGGWWETFASLVMKYGAVPKSVMPDNIPAMFEAGKVVEQISARLALAYREINLEIAAQPSVTPERRLTTTQISDQALADIWRILEANFGRPPEEFKMTFSSDKKPKVSEQNPQVYTMESKTAQFTPKEFYNTMLGHLDLINTFTVVTSNPLRDYGKTYASRASRYDRKTGSPRIAHKTLNLPPQRIGQLIMASLAGGVPVWYASDVMKDFDPVHRIMDTRLYDPQTTYGISRQKLSDEELRKLYLTTGTGGPTHAMVFTGYAGFNPKTGTAEIYRTENSWDTDAPWIDEQPYHTRANWVARHVYEIVVPRSVLTSAEQDVLRKKPVIADDQET